MSNQPSVWLLCLCGFVELGGTSLSWSAEPAQSTPIDLTELSIEELLRVEVTSVALKSQPINQAPAAIFVLTQEDIRRSGANSIPEALRLVPGLIVARIDSNKWAISSRSETERFSDDLLVMVDGKTVWSPSLAGTFWETIDTVLEDIDRIEVIRGPGGTLLGANAVNGAINIITKKAKDTQGGLVTVGGGTEERAFTSVRYGGHLGQDFHFRVFGKAFERDRNFNETGSHDDWRMGRGGVRADWDVTSDDVLTLQSTGYTGRAGQQSTIPTLLAPDFTQTQAEDVRLQGQDVLLRWGHTFSKQSDLTLQLYYDRMQREEISFKERRHTYDLDLRHRFPLFSNQEIVWGFGFRSTTDDIDPNRTFSVDPAQRTLQTFKGLIQDELRLFKDQLRVAVGAQFLAHSYTGLLVQPTIRVSWTLNDRHALWAAVNRSNRVPSRLEREGLQREEGSGTGFSRLVGNPNQRAEDLWGFEAGYRATLHPSLSVDLTAFYTTERHSPTEREISPDVEQYDNGEHLQSYGGEVALNWQALSWWRLRPTFSALRVTNHLHGDQIQEQSGQPAQQAGLRSLMSLTETIELDANYRFVDRIAAFGISNYHNLDVRLGWRPTKAWELSLVGHNLIEAHHQEFLPGLFHTQRTDVQRGVYGKVTWRF